jgi:hypothetical protein
VIGLHTHSPQRNDNRDVFVERVVLQHKQIDLLRILLAADDVCLRFDVRRMTCHRCLDDSLELFDDDTVFAQLLLDEDDLLRASYNEVSSRVDGALVQQAHVRFGPAIQHTFATSQHHGHSTDHDIASHGLSGGFWVNVVDVNWRSISHVS